MSDLAAMLGLVSGDADQQPMRFGSVEFWNAATRWSAILGTWLYVRWGLLP